MVGCSVRQTEWSLGKEGRKKKGRKESVKNEVDLEHNSPHAVVESLVMMTTFLSVSLQQMRGKFGVEVSR